MTYFLNRRDGLSSLIAVARKLCRLITEFEPVIRRLYPDNTALLAALAAAAAACRTLEAEAAKQKAPGV